MTARQVDRSTDLRLRWMVATVALSAVILSSCNEIAGPIRPDGYGYTLIASDVVATTDTIDGVIYTAGDTITDTVDFKWPTSSLPVRIWAESDSLALPSHFANAIATWKGVLEYGEFDGVMVGDSNHADIIVRDLPAPPMASRLRSVRELIPPVLACEGATDIVISKPDHRRLLTPTRIYIQNKFALSDTATTPCLARVAKHELGHALGLFQHSPNPDDLMAALPTVDAPSDVDIATVLWVYHQPTKLRPAPAADTLSSAPSP